MFKKWEILKKITDSGLVVVVRADNADMAKKITDACLEGGAAAIEITYTVPGATKVIEELAKEYAGKIIIGAGTVLDAETARIAILSGAQYVVSPYLSRETLKLCNRYRSHACRRHDYRRRRRSNGTGCRHIESFPR